MEKRPLNEGVTRGQIKGGLSKPPTTQGVRPSSPPPPAKPQTVGKK